MPGSAEEVLGKVRALRPEIRERAAEIEALRRVPPDLVDKLKAAGVFRMYAPESHGGLEVDFPEGLKVISEVARADGSTGWAVMIGSAGALILSRLPRQTFDQVFAAYGPDMIQAGLAGAPRGRAERVEGGYRVSGEWPFSSGCEHADFIIGACVVTEGGEPLPGPIEGMPLVRIVGLPAKAWTIKDTWSVAGLKGTGSHTTVLKDVFVPEAQTLELGGPSCLPGALYNGLGPWIPLMHGAFATGLAEGVIDDLIALARTGRRQLFARAAMQDSPIFQYELGQLAAEVAAAKALLEARAVLQWRRAQAGELGSPAVQPDSAQAGLWVTHAALKVADAGFVLAGAAALYDASPLQRRLRDMNAATQHAVVQKQNYQGLGAGLLSPPA